VERGDATAAIPIEFAVAAYRYGHSQIRDRYAVNDDSGEVPFFPSPDPPAVPEGLLPDDVGLEAIEERLKAEGVDAAPDHVDATSAAGGERSLAGFGRLPPDLVVDWSYLAADAPVGEASFDGPLQPGRAIDAELPPSLFDLPFVVEGVESLAARNLLRGRTFGLPSGQAVAEALGRAPLSNADLPIDEGRSYADYLRERRRGADVEAPLWLYVIAEADAHNDGDRLGAVGSRLVGEVLHGLIHADTESYVNAEPDWTPTLPTRESTPDGEFRLADLLAFAAGPARDGLAVADVYPDGTGAPPLVVDGDDPTNGEAIELVHEGRATLSMRGYTAFYGDAGQQFEIPSLTLEPGETALVYTGAGDPDTDGTAVCLGLDRPVINDDGDRVVVRTSAGGVCDHVVT
jgi:hypothetical protein